ncbi:MAG TPA: hypothetical protein VKI44_27635 [Acetobacteraceae bacterium]|nr:hypothetical protein [Acetobacteraceae bacterium]
MAYIPFRPRSVCVAFVLAALASGGTAATAPGPARADEAAVEVPPAKAGETLADVLLPGGKPVGLTSKKMRELAGGEQAANALFNRLTAGAADVTPPNFPGVVRKRSDGATITYLLPVKGGAPPTILVQSPNFAIRELQFPPNPGRDGGGDG